MRILLNEEKSLNLEEEKGYLKFVLGCQFQILVLQIALVLGLVFGLKKAPASDQEEVDLEAGDQAGDQDESSQLLNRPSP